jgi:hypothetical protein
MRVAVVTAPRTGSTFCLKLISTALNLKNYEEILNELVYIFPDSTYLHINTHMTNDMILEKLLNTDDYVVKLIAAELFERDLNVNNFPWNIFDAIILLERDNIFEQITSWYNLGYWQQKILKQNRYKEYYVKEKFIRFAVDCIKKYHFVKDIVIQNTNNTFVVKKENIVQDISRIFNVNVTDETIKTARKKLVPECDLNDIDYELIMSNQNIKQRVLHILEQELNGKNSYQSV